MSTTLTFQQGVGGYAGTVDTNLRGANPTTSYAVAKQLFTDSDTAGAPGQALLRFDGLFGTGPGQIPLGATILSASLTLQTSDTGDGGALHRMLRSWSDTDTWTSLGSGIQADGVEAVATADLVTGRMGTTGSRTFDVTASVAAWAAGEANLGWAVLPLGTDGWGFQSAEGSTKPQLTIVYEIGTTPLPTLSLSGPLTQAEGNSGTTTFSFTVTRAGDTSQPASASWAVTGSGTNPAGANDFAGGTLPTGTVSFAAGETSQTIAVQVAADTIFEPDETFTLALSSPNGATLATASTTGTITNDDAPPAQAFDESYIATSYSGRMRALEYGNASKSFFHDGHWFAVLPDGSKWAVERFDGPLPGAGQRGGWTKASTDGFLDNNRVSDIAWDDATDSLYVLQYSVSSTSPRMFKLGYDTATDRFVQSAEAQIAGPGGELSSASWSKNAELVIGMDSFGTPLVANIGKTTSGADRGLNLAWASKDLATWSEVRIDAAPTSAGGNSKADIVSFTLDGTPMIGIAYSADTAGIRDNGAYGDWKFAWRPASANPADYASGWTIETTSASVNVDNHMAAAWDGRHIFIVMKDDHNDIWLTRGLPGSWETVKVVDSTGPALEPSRPTIVVDKADDRLLIFYQQDIDAPYGDIYMKTLSLTGPLDVDPYAMGIRAMRTTSGSSLVDPQGPVHAVDAGMDGAFHLFAANADLREVWSNRVDLGVGELIG